MRRRVRSIAVLMTLVAASAAAPKAAAQPPAVDAGTFTLTRNGERIGEETFTLNRTGANVFHLAVRSTIGSRLVKLDLFADSLGVPTQYQYEASENGARTVVIIGQRDANRFRVQTTPTGGGGSYNELLATPGLLIADDELVSTFVFAARGGARPVMAVLPRKWSQKSGAIRVAGQETIAISGSNLSATRYALSIAGSDDRYDVWSGASGQLLKVEIPSRGLTALRQAPPR